MASSDDHFGAVRAFLERARSASSVRVERLEPLENCQVTTARWQLDELTGRLIELAGLGAVASLSVVASLVLEAQVRGEPVAWLVRPTTTFFPPDLAERGIDLDALVVVHVLDVNVMFRAADRLLRSGAFGLLVLDLGTWGSAAEVPIAIQGRLAGLAQHHDAAVVLITEKSGDCASLGSIVSLRAEAARERAGGGFRVVVRASKDKRRGPGWAEQMSAFAPPGFT